MLLEESSSLKHQQSVNLIEKQTPHGACDGRYGRGQSLIGGMRRAGTQRPPPPLSIKCNTIMAKPLTTLSVLTATCPHLRYTV